MSINSELAYYINLDTRNATFSESKFLKKLHENKGVIDDTKEIDQTQLVATTHGFDEDILEWMMNQDKETQNHINEIIRHIMTMRQMRPIR